MKRILTAVVVAISLSGCITTKLVNSKMKVGESQDLQVVHHEGFGDPTATPSCPHGVASIAQGGLSARDLCPASPLVSMNP